MLNQDTNAGADRPQAGRCQEVWSPGHAPRQAPVPHGPPKAAESDHFKHAASRCLTFVEAADGQRGMQTTSQPLASTAAAAGFLAPACLVGPIIAFTAASTCLGLHIFPLFITSRTDHVNQFYKLMHSKFRLMQHVKKAHHNIHSGGA